MRDTDYLKIRKLYTKLAHSLLKLDKRSKSRMMDAGKRLGFWNGTTLIFEDESEMDYLMDCVLYEKSSIGNNLIQQIEKDGHSFPPQEQLILNGMLNNYDSVFEVTEVNKHNSTLTLEDLRTDSTFILKDIGFSNTAMPGLIIYARLIPIEDVNMTSGISFAFYPENKQRILTLISKQPSKLFRRNPKKKIHTETLFEKMLKFNSSNGIPVVHLGEDDLDDD